MTTTRPTTVVIPMAGLSRRFSQAGYTLPKYMLSLHGRSVFAHAVDSFRTGFASDRFVFAARDVAGTTAFIRDECDNLGIQDYSIVLIEAPTSGQAETVELAVRGAAIGGEDPITIFNIDTFRPGFRFPDKTGWHSSAGYLEVFRGSGANWSNVRPAASLEPIVLETAEKREISDLCCTGLYHFERTEEFLNALIQERSSMTSRELYVAPLYNWLIREGFRIHYNLIEGSEVIFCGVPLEYEALRRQPP